MSVSRTDQRPISKLTSLADVEPSHDNNFHLIRMLAASGVLLSHGFLVTRGDISYEPLWDTLGVTLGHVGVLIFFSISGFFIARSYDRSRDLWQFVWARCLRLFPALAVVLLLTIVIGGLWISTADAEQYWSVTPTYFWRNLTMMRPVLELPGVFENLPVERRINGSLWTLFYEVICYFGVAFAGLTGLLWQRRNGTLVATGVALTFVAIQVLSPPLHTVILNLAVLGLPFVVGVLFYLLRDFISLNLLAASVLLGVTAPLAHTVWFEPAFAVAIAYAVFCLGYVKCAFLAWYNRVGDFSYGIYIYAFPVQQIGVKLGYSEPWSNIAFALPVTFGCALLSWYFVEAPMLKFKSLSLKKRQRG